MSTVVTRWYTREEADRLKRPLRDSEGIRTGMVFMDGAMDADAAAGARDAARQAMVDHLGSAWQGDAVFVSRADKEAVFEASIAAAEATGRRVADSRADSLAAYEQMVAALGSAWRTA